MAERIEIKTVSTPAGTLKAAPLVTALTWREGHPERVEIRVPPGPLGLVGVQIAHSGRVIIPRDASEFLETDDEVVSWPLDGFATGAAYTVRTYNTDVYPHAVQIRMLFNEIGAEELERRTPPLIETLTPSPGLLGEGLEAVR